MFAGGVEGDPARTIGKIDTDLVEQRRRRVERRVVDRQYVVAHRSVIGRGCARLLFMARNSEGLLDRLGVGADGAARVARSWIVSAPMSSRMEVRWIVAGMVVPGTLSISNSRTAMLVPCFR
jgi:hypothetical protein